MMRILVVGAGRVGAHVLRQLQKNSSLAIITCDPHQEPFAVQKGVINSVDIQEALTPLNLAYVIEQAEPDLILLTRTSADFGLGKVPGMDMMVQSMRMELSSISNVPLIEVGRTLG